MFKRYFPLISGLLLFLTLLSFWFFPYATPALGITILLFAVFESFLSVFGQYKGSSVPRSKIIREVMKTLLIILVVVVIGGIAGLFAGRLTGVYVEARWNGMGIVVGFITAIITSFAVGYVIRRGIGKLSRR